MKIEIIDFGGKKPQRAHYNDAGADVFARVDDSSKTNDYYTYDIDSQQSYPAIEIMSHSIKKIPLGFGLKLPDGLVAFVVPRSGMSANKGITAEIVPIDSGYTGEIHAILYNASSKAAFIKNGDKIAQLVIMPVVLAEFEYELGDSRGTKGFGSSGDK